MHKLLEQGHSAAQAHRHLWLLGVLSLLVYGAMTWLSYAFVYGQGHEQRPILAFVAWYGVAFALYVIAIRQLPHLPQQRSTLLVVLGFAFLFRVTLLCSNPIQEDDFYRYLWDGTMVANGLNPYSVAPRQVQTQRKPGAEIERRAQIATQDPNLALILSRVNHPSVPTIYPPLAQAVFGLTALVAPGSLLVLRLALLLFDLGICGVIVLMLKRLDANPLWMLVYAWSPLVIKETANSAHYDVAPTFFLMVAVWLSLRGAVALTYTSLALGVLGKLYPILLAPVFLKRTWEMHGLSRAFFGGLILIGVIALGYAPFLDAGAMLWNGTLTFAGHWRTNSLIFPLVQSLVSERWLANAITAVLLGGTILLLLSRFSMHEARSFLWVTFLTLGVWFLVSPVGNPWYFLWVVPLLCVFPRWSWLLLSGLLGLYYLSFYLIYRDLDHTFRWVIWLEYVPFYLCWFAEWGKSQATPLEALHRREENQVGKT